MQSLRIWLEEKAKIAGFDKLAVTKAILPEEVGDRLSHFIAEDRQGDMAWLAESQYRRAQPQHMWPEARTALVLACNYGPDHNPMDNLAAAEAGNISVYARSKDYHDILKGQLKQLAGQLVAKTGWQVKVFVDTAPVPEKALAAQTTVGWQGKHSNLVSPTYGSWLFLGVIYLSFDVPADAPAADQCGSCTRCIDICPTRAIPAPYTLDATRCLAYLSIEHKGSIPVEFRKAMGNRIYGCDDCLAVCPWNKFATATAEAGFKPRDIVEQAQLLDFTNFDDAAFRAAFSGSPVKRIGIERFLRNLAICLGNSGHEKAREPLQQLARSENAVVAESAQWALTQLSA